MEKKYEVNCLLWPESDGGVAEPIAIQFMSLSDLAWRKMAELVWERMQTLASQKRISIVYFAEQEGDSWKVIDTPEIRSGFEYLLRIHASTLQSSG